MEETPTDIKSELIDEIVCKVKSEGLFDQFRRECLADVDTKPAYQNLQHRVESSVSSYLGEQTWTPQLNKNQLREKLRKLITEKGFFEAGIERIVDQVVNPKLSSNLVPKIEDVAYKFLGVEKPSYNIKLELQVADEETSLPNLDLEQVSPESSEKSPSIESKSPALLANTMDAYHMHDESDDRMDDLESPAFEPIHASPTFEFKQEIVEKQDDDMDISDGDDDGPLQMNGSMMIANDEVKSNLSSISGLTSNDSNNDITNGIPESEIKCEEVETSTNYDQDEQTAVMVEKDEIHIENCVAPEITIDSAEKLPQSENIISNTNEMIVENMNQDSVLSQVSSTSRLSIVTNNNTNTRMDDGDGDGDGYSNHMSNEPQHIVRETCPYGISEEAQMQKFNESSSSSNSLVIDTDNISNGTNQCDKREELMTSFDIKREEIKFEGTERKSFDLSLSDSNEDKFNRCVPNNDSANNIYSMGTTMISDHRVKTENLILNKQTSEIGKLDEIDSTNTENMIMSIKSEFNSKSTSIDEKPSTPDTDDSKDKNSDSKLSLNRNGNDSDSSKYRGKDSSHHSSSRHRSHSEREKDRKSSSSRALKDKTKCLKEGSDSKDGSSKHRSSSSSSKHRHHKNESSRSSSSSSTKKDKESSRDRSDKSKFDKSSPPSLDSGHAKKGHESSSATTNTSKKEHSRHSSSSSSNSKHRSSSRKDDHSIYKEKSSSRQRSRSKDSNDGSTHLQFGSQNVFNSAENSNANQSSSNNNQSSGTCSNETQAITSHSIDQQLEAVTEEISSRKTTIESSDTNEQQITSTQEDEEFVLITKPVVVDQILAGNELNLEVFIGENRDDPVVSSIEQTLEQEVKKPKVAANIFEAKRLSKIRKEIERNKRKKLEQATVLAKKYIRTNPSTVRDDSQGVELEFACMISNSGTASVGPIISSPAKYKNGIIESKTLTPNATITSSSLNMDSTLDESKSIETFAMECKEIAQSSDDRIINENNNETVMTDMQNDETCLGFDEKDLELARNSSLIFLESLKSIIEKAPLRNRSKIITKKINNAIFAPSTEEERHLLLETLNNQLLFLENNKLNEPTSKSLLNRKRFAYDVPPNASNKMPTSTNDNEMILASVFISQTSTECSVKPDSSTRSDAEPMSALEKQRQKTRYSNDDLFKPRPVLGGISRRRRLQ